MGSDNSGYYFGNDEWYRSPAKVASLCVLIIILCFIYVYAWRTCRRHARETAQATVNGGSSSSAHVLQSQQLSLNKGLHPSLVDSLPTFLYNPTHLLPIAECSVCLSNLEEGEMVKLIPTCKHMFHLQCINMWLSSHPTCPICRSPAYASSTAGHHEMTIWIPSLVSSPATTTSSEITSGHASSQTSRE